MTSMTSMTTVPSMTVAELVRDARAEPEVDDTEITIRPEPEGTRVEKTGDNEFRLHGRSVYYSAETISAANERGFIIFQQ